MGYQRIKTWRGKGKDVVVTYLEGLHTYPLDENTPFNTMLSNTPGVHFYIHVGKAKLHVHSLGI
jgi:hypothetical protein